MQIDAIIVKKQHTREHDQWITCYTKEMGKLTASAKSIFKNTSKQGMQLDVLNRAQFELVEGKAMPIITGAQLEDGYRSLKSSLSATSMAYFFLEVIDKVIFDHQRDEKLWNFLQNTLCELNESEKPLSWFRIKQLELLDILGYMPQVQKCALCHSGDCSRKAALYLEVGGLICESCFLQVGRGVLLVQDDIAMLQGKYPESVASSIGSSIIDAIFEYTFGIRFSSLNLLYNIDSVRAIV